MTGNYLPVGHDPSFVVRATGTRDDLVLSRAAVVAAGTVRFLDAVLVYTMGRKVQTVASLLTSAHDTCGHRRDF